MTSLSAALDSFVIPVNVIGTGALLPAITETIVAKALPPGVADGVRKTLMFLCSVACASTTEKPENWKSLLGTYTFAVFPSLASDQDVMSAISVETFSATDVATLTALKDDLRSGDVGEITAGIVACSLGLLGVPLPADIDVEFFADSGRPNVVYAHYSLVVYLAGKIIGDHNRTSIEVARPRALISKYRLGMRADSATVMTLNGECKMSHEAHDGFNRAWLEMPGFRIPVLKAVVKSCQVGNQIAHDIMSTTISLLAFSQMSHALFCKDLLASEPWVEGWAALAPAVASFKSSAFELAKVEPVYRAYVKLIYQDKVRIFLRRDLLPLVECALADLRVPGSTMSAYFSDSSQALVVAAFKAERSSRRATLASIPPAVRGVASPPPVTAPPTTAAAPAPSGPLATLEEDEPIEEEEEEDALAPAPVGQKPAPYSMTGFDPFAGKQYSLMGTLGREPLSFLGPAGPADEEPSSPGVTANPVVREPTPVAAVPKRETLKVDTAKPPPSQVTSPVLPTPLSKNQQKKAAAAARQEEAKARKEQETKRVQEEATKKKAGAAKESKVPPSATSTTSGSKWAGALFGSKS